MKEYLNNTPNAKEGTGGQKWRELKWIAMWVLKNGPTEQFSKLIRSACNLKVFSFCYFDFWNIIFQVRTSRIGYYTLNEDLTITSNTEKHAMIQQDMVISPRLSLRGSDDMYRIVLTWGRSPKDLDSYLITPWKRDADCQSGMVGCQPSPWAFSYSLGRAQGPRKGLGTGCHSVTSRNFAPNR